MAMYLYFSYYPRAPLAFALLSYALSDSWLRCSGAVPECATKKEIFSGRLVVSLPSSCDFDIGHGCFI